MYHDCKMQSENLLMLTLNAEYFAYGTFLAIQEKSVVTIVCSRSLVACNLNNEIHARFRTGQISI